MQQQRVPVKSPSGQTLMPTTPQRARRWEESGKAVKRWSKLGVCYFQLVSEPSGTATQPIVVGVDPGKLYSGVGVQSAKYTLYLAHLELPFKTVKKRMEQRAMMRRTRRGRRINRTVAFKLRSHRQKRFSNRRSNKLPPSIRANRQLELRVVKELCALYPVSSIVYEYIEARGSKSFSPVMVGQKVMLGWLSELAPVSTQFGWQTAQIRNQLGLVKLKNKSSQVAESHAVDGIALASSQFVRYQSFETLREHGHQWVGSVQLTPSIFQVIKRPPISRRQLHLFQPAKGGERRAYGGTVTRHNGLRKGDLVKSEMAGREYIGYVSGDTARQVSVSDSQWKRLGQFTASKVQLIRRSVGLLINTLHSVSLRGIEPLA
jgi:RRXRR protein